ncbi:MAG TPA: hypothetical protein VMF05_07980 [Stellaceae bacterium]|nr:hypothetical protein [Stellaceae bacterium]
MGAHGDGLFPASGVGGLFPVSGGHAFMADFGITGFIMANTASSWGIRFHHE